MYPDTPSRLRTIETVTMIARLVTTKSRMRFPIIFSLAGPVEILQDLSAAPERCYHPFVSVFKRHSGDHIHVRTPVMIGVIVLLVFVLSAFCYYRVGTS